MNIGHHEPVINPAVEVGGLEEVVAAAGMVAPNPVHGALAVCGVSDVASRNVFIQVEGLDSIEAFGALSGDPDVTEMAKRMASRTINAGRVILGTMQIKRIQALVFWVKDHEKRQVEINPDAWTDEELRSTLARKEADQNFEKLDIDIVDPGKCQTDFGWDTWQIAFTNKLSATMGAAKVPLAYVIRTDIGANYEYEDDEEVRMYQMPLTGENFKRDNKLVYAMLKAACIKTDAWTWIQDHDKSANGRKAWISLIGHYDGTGELNKRLERAKEEISRLHYKDEKVFPFERYVTKLKENFFILSKDKDEELTGKQKVDVMMKGIKSSDASIVAAKTDIYKDYRSDFSAATNFLSGLISNIHSAAQLDYSSRQQSGKKRYISAVNTRDQRGGRGRFRRGGRSGERGVGRGDGRGRGRNSRARMQINGIDVSDPTRNFSSDEWERLGTARAYVTQQRSIANGRSSGGRTGGRSTSTPRGGNNDGRNASATQTSTNDNSNDTSNHDNQSQSNTTISERGSQNGRSFGRGAYN
jgi:hypothetical protein